MPVAHKGTPLTPPPPGVPYDLSPAFVNELFSKHKIDYIIHGDDPCLLPDGTDAYAHAKKAGRFKLVRGRLWPCRPAAAALCSGRWASEGAQAPEPPGQEGGADAAGEAPAAAAWLWLLQ